MAEVEVAEPQPDLVWDDQVRGLLENGRGSSARLSTRATTPRVTIANPIGLILSEMSCDTSPRIRLITTARNNAASPPYSRLGASVPTSIKTALRRLFVLKASLSLSGDLFPRSRHDFKCLFVLDASRARGQFSTLLGVHSILRYGFHSASMARNN
jgi:hypothetical protein